MKVSDILNKIKRKEIFSAYVEDQSFFIAVDEWVPFACFAIHNGSNLRPELREKISLSKMDRWKEEDPYTGQFVSSLPIRIISFDSRFEYDLNRPKEKCIYSTAWEKNVWNLSLSEEEISRSLAKHENFYKVVHSLVEALEEQFNAAVIYDIHSYNHERHSLPTPLFNIGCEKIRPKFSKDVQKWQSILNSIKISGVETSCELNGVFKGHGELLNFVTKEFRKTLVLATEIKKIYCDENTGDEFPEIIDQLTKAIKESILSHAKVFANSKTKMHVNKKYVLLSSKIPSQVTDVDNGIFVICRDFELLNNIEPVNISSEKKRFLSNRFKYTPKFRYKPLKIDPKSVRNKLFSLPIASIPDINLQELYHQVVDAQASQIEMLADRASRQFFYHSLRYFGEPGDDEISTAHWLLKCPSYGIANESKKLKNAWEVKEVFQNFCMETGLSCKIDIVRNMAAKAMFIPSKNRLRVNASGMFTEMEALSLAHHEIGIHCLTTLNARHQPLKILQTGFPVYTYTQEGLAILAEFFSGNLSMDRLKELALRVMAVRSLIAENSFNETFLMLSEEYDTPDDKAFDITLRVYRGGGMTKDYLYLKGFRELLDSFETNPRTTDLLVGKTSITNLSLISELIDREILNKPKYIPKVFEARQPLDILLDFVVKGVCQKTKPGKRTPKRLKKTMGF